VIAVRLLVLMQVPGGRISHPKWLIACQLACTRMYGVCTCLPILCQLVFDFDFEEPHASFLVQHARQNPQEFYLSMADRAVQGSPNQSVAYNRGGMSAGCGFAFSYLYSASVYKDREVSSQLRRLRRRLRTVPW
jgi:hypothetical protein